MHVVIRITRGGVLDDRDLIAELGASLNSENEIPLGDFSVYLSCAASVMATTTIDAETIATAAATIPVAFTRHRFP